MRPAIGCVLALLGAHFLLGLYLCQAFRNPLPHFQKRIRFRQIRHVRSIRRKYSLSLNWAIVCLLWFGV